MTNQSDQQQLERVLDGLVIKQQVTGKFACLTDELDAVASWKCVSVFDVFPESDDLDELLQAAAERQLRTVILPNLNSEKVTDLSVYVCGGSQEWRIEALRCLQDRVHQGGGGWTDDFVRIESMLRGYSIQDAESWVLQNRELSGFWSGWRRTFIGFETTDSDHYTIALNRRLPAKMANWWTLDMSVDLRWRSDARAVSQDCVVVRTSLREDSLADAYSVGETIKFERWPELRARRVRPDGALINTLLKYDLDIIAMAPVLLHSDPDS